MLILEVMLWLGCLLGVIGIVLALRTNEAAYLVFLTFGCVIVLLVCTIAIAEFGQLPSLLEALSQIIFGRK